MAKNDAMTIRRIYRASKRSIGRAATRDGFQKGPIRSQALIATAAVSDIAISEVKALLRQSAGPKTTRSPGERRESQS